MNTIYHSKDLDVYETNFTETVLVPGGLAQDGVTRDIKERLLSLAAIKEYISSGNTQDSKSRALVLIGKIPFSRALPVTFGAPAQKEILSSQAAKKKSWLTSPLALTGFLAAFIGLCYLGYNTYISHR